MTEIEIIIRPIQEWANNIKEDAKREKLNRLIVELRESLLKLNRPGN